MVSIEARVKEFEKRTGMKSNNIFWGVLDTAVDNIIEEVEKHKLLTKSEFQSILDKHTNQFKNPEWSAVRTEAVNDLKYIWKYQFNDLQIWRDWE